MVNLVDRLGSQMLRGGGQRSGRNLLAQPPPQPQYMPSQYMPAPSHFMLDDGGGMLDVQDSDSDAGWPQQRTQQLQLPGPSMNQMRQYGGRMVSQQQRHFASALPSVGAFVSAADLQQMQMVMYNPRSSGGSGGAGGVSAEDIASAVVNAFRNQRGQ